MSINVCSIDGCNRPRRGLGYCSAHYMRWHRHGDPLAGRAMRLPAGLADTFFRTVILPYTSDDCLLWPYHCTPAGHASMWFEGRPHPVARLVCAHFNGPPPTPKHEAAHLCGNGHLACVAPSHVVWKTSKENSDDQLRHGTRAYGEAVRTAKLTARDIDEIQALRGIMPQRTIAARFGVSQSSINRIFSGETWGWMTKGTPPPHTLRKGT